MKSLRRQRNVKIVATLGPASDTYEMIRALFETGADVFRLNMSHGVHEDIARRHALIRRVEADLGRPIGILADLQGPKLRCGTFAGGPVTLQEGATFRFDLDPADGDVTRVCLPHPEIFQALAGRLQPPRQRRQDPPQGHRALPGARGDRGGRRRRDLQPQGRQRPRRRPPPRRALAQGQEGPRVRLRARRRLARALLRPARHRRLRGARARRRPRRDPVEDREARGRQRLRRDPRRLRRHHGRPRRPRRRAPRLLGPADPEAPDPRLPRRRQAGDRRDPDAREHDHRARSRPAPRSPTSPPRSTRAPTRSCSRPSPPPATSRSRRSRR